MLKLLALNIFLFFHPVHVTLTTITQAQESDTLNVFFRMYFEDFQRDYMLYYPDFKGRSGNDTTAIPHEKLNRYFNDRVRIYINKELLSGTLTDVKINSYEISLNLVYHSDKNARSLRISNKILTSLYPDQANMVYLNINKYQDALKLTPGNEEGAVSIK
jgi:hypothetical protein